MSILHNSPRFFVISAVSLNHGSAMVTPIALTAKMNQLKFAPASGGSVPKTNFAASTTSASQNTSSVTW